MESVELNSMRAMVMPAYLSAGAPEVACREENKNRMQGKRKRLLKRESLQVLIRLHGPMQISFQLIKELHRLGTGGIVRIGPHVDYR